MSEDLVTVYSTMTHWEAVLLKSYLEENGVPTHVAFEAIGPLYGLVTPGIGEIRVQVLARDAELAVGLVEEYAREQA